MQPKLPPDVKAMCSRVALERMRPAIKQTSLELRKDALRVLQSGQPPEAVRAWLQGLQADALAAQA
jgi:hypothetical protein